MAAAPMPTPISTLTPNFTSALFLALNRFNLDKRHVADGHRNSGLRFDAQRVAGDLDEMPLHLRAVLKPHADERAGLELLGERAPDVGRLLRRLRHCRRRRREKHEQLIRPPALVLTRIPVVRHPCNDPRIVVVMPRRQQRPRLVRLEQMEEIDVLSGSPDPMLLTKSNPSIRVLSRETLHPSATTRSPRASAGSAPAR